MEKVLVICASCKKPFDYTTCHRMYVGMGSNQYVCKACQGKPFIEVMENSARGETYIGIPPKTLEELQSEGVKHQR